MHQTVVDALTIVDKVLLVVAWTTNEGRLSHMKYPDVLRVDVTYGKDNEKQYQFCVIGKNAHNRDVLIIDNFLPP